MPAVDPPRPSVVMPSAVEPELRDYWERAEQLTREFLAETGVADIGLPHHALQGLCHWPVHAARYWPAWQGWHRCFDATTLKRLDPTLVLNAIAPCLAAEPEQVPATLAAFLRWLGRRGVLDSESAERLALGFVDGAAGFVRRMDDEVAELYGEHSQVFCIDDVFLDDADDGDDHSAAAAEFMLWLKDTTALSEEHCLFGGGLVLRALDVLDVQRFDQGAWRQLDLAACVRKLNEQDNACGLPIREQVRVAHGLLSFLHGRGLISRADKVRMGKRAELTATSHRLN